MLRALSYETRFRWIFSEFWTRRRENFEAYSENISRNFHKAAVKIQKKDAELEFRNSKLKGTRFSHLKNLDIFPKVQTIYVIKQFLRHTHSAHPYALLNHLKPKMLES